WRDRQRAGRADRFAPRVASSRPVEDAPKSAWRRYVEKFSADYELDDAQRRAAASILKEMEERAAPVLRDYDAVVAALKGAEGGAREKSQRKRDQLDADLDKRFTELQKRLEGLLTSAQRARGAPPAGGAGS